MGNNKKYRTNFKKKQGNSRPTKYTSLIFKIP